MGTIETSGLTRRFGDVVAVDDLDMTVERGEAFGFLGPNGAGKSTTISVLLGFLEPTAGEVRVLGESEMGPSVRERVGLLPEGCAPYDNLTGREHVTSAVRAKGADDDPTALLDRVGLDPDDADRPAGDYSKGMQQRLFLAVALVGAPDLLVLDEPASGLDPSGVRLLRRIVAEEVDRGATVFFSSHDLDEVERVCDRVGIMREGELVAVNDVDDLRSELGVGAVVEATLETVPETLEVDGVDGITDVAVDGRTVRVRCARPEAKMPALAALNDAATVVDVGVEEASLETVFERYTTGDRPDGTGESSAATGTAAPEGSTDAEAGDTTASLAPGGDG